MLGEQLKKAFNDARIPSQEAADRMGMSKANLYILFKKDTFEVEYLRKASEITGKPLQYFLEAESTILDSKPSDGGAFGEKVIGQMAEGIEELKKMFEEELRAKNLQIAGLQRMLESVLGKSKGATSTQLSEEEMFNLTMDAYRQSGLSQVFSPVVSQPRKFNVPMLAKSVALGSL